jgi:hypothetical protein
MPKRLKGRTAWLVTWEWAGDHAAVTPDEVVAAVLPPQRSADSVRQIIEILYAARQYSAVDKLQALRHNPYPASFGSIAVNSRSGGPENRSIVPFHGQIHCGHNPYLYGRLVDDLRVADATQPPGTLAWRERPLPALELPPSR